MAYTRQPRAAKEDGIQRYGLPYIKGWSQLKYDCKAFAERLPITTGVPVRRELLKRITDIIFPRRLEWHLWTQRIMGTLCDYSEIGNRAYVLAGFPGCSSSGKTYNVTNFAVAWWLCAPSESSVILISTSKGSLRRRAWAEVTRAYTEIPGDRLGNFVDSRTMWQWDAGDDKHAIFGKAVEEGPTLKVADDIKGIHTKRQMVVIDEATSVPAAIYEACANLHSYPDEFILVLIGNPLNRLDQFGRFCEPDGGWLSVTVDTGEWDAKPQENIAGIKPRIVTFDAEKSPNLIEGKIVSRHLPKKEEIEASKKASGGGNTPLYWQNKRGFWPPEGINKTVFSESGLIVADAYGRQKFTGRWFQILGSFDPARTGDRAALRFAKLGEIVGGKWGIQLMPAKVIPINVQSKNPIAFQLCEQCKREAEKIEHEGQTYSCQPENFILDDTGDGGLGDIFHRMWSPNIHRVKFSWAASEDPCSLEDPRPAKEVWRNKRAEMWFRTRNSVDAGQFKGLDAETAKELVNMEFDDSKTKIVLMEKLEYKVEFGYSPDFADCAVMINELARIKGFKLAAMGKTAEKIEENSHFADDAQRVYLSEFEAEEVGEMAET